MRWGTGPGSFGESELDVSSETHTTAGFVQSVDLNRDGLLDPVVGHHTCSGGKGLWFPSFSKESDDGNWRQTFFGIPAVGDLLRDSAVSLSPEPEYVFLTGRNCNKSDPYDPFLMETGRTKSGAVQWEGVDNSPGIAGEEACSCPALGP